MSKKYLTDDYHRKLIAGYWDNVEMPGGWSFNQPEELKTIDLYYNSKYKTGQYDSQGFRKFFDNRVTPACDIATKFIDIDTGNINLHAEHARDELRVFLMQRRLKQWLKDSDFGVLLNDMTHVWPIYGHLVVKKSKEGWKLVPLQNLRHNPSAAGMVTDSFAEIYCMTLDSMKEMGWDTSELEKMAELDEYIVYDCFTRNGSKWTRQVKAELWSYKHGDGIQRSVESEINRRGTKYTGAVVLYTEELKKHMYRELKWKNVPGRAMGMGFVEYLKDDQIARNEVWNLEMRSLAVHSTPIFQTRDEDLDGKNTIVNYKPGQIFHANSEVTPVAVEARNLPQFTEIRQNVDQGTERKTFTSDITTGASLPSRTPLGVANQQVAMAASFFERKREELGLFLKDLLIEDQIPSFVNDTAKEHTMIFSCADEESTYLDDAITEAMIGEKIAEYTDSTGYFPSKEQKDFLRVQVKDQLKGSKNRFLKIPDGFWKNAKYMVDIDITGESTDVSVKSQLVQMVLQIAGTNPMALQDPNSRSLIFKLLDLGGISPVELGLTYQSPNQTQMQPQVAGSLARPTAAGMPSPMNV